MLQPVYGWPSDAIVASLRGSHGAEASISAAARVLRHEFDLLGSGPFVPRDPERSPSNGYAPIDWYLDPVRQLRFPRGVPFKSWNLYQMRPPNADIKYPWELARSQHWAALAQAHRLTGDHRFALEIGDELDDFMQANPVGVGINWTCTMDVALRAVSWVIGLQLVRDCAALDDPFWRRAHEALFLHGTFIRDNLENTYEVTSNHFLSNVVGLWFLGAAFADTRAGDLWRQFAHEALEREIDAQVLPDGADFESSVPYHRLVTELFLGSLRLGDSIGEPLSDRYRARVRDMVAYLAAIVRPDGLMPQVGDADDGRLHMFSGYGASPQDPRHLFGPAGVIFDEPAWIQLGGEDAVWEAAWWGLDASGAAPVQPPRASRLFPQAGVAVMCARETDYVLVTNGIVGTKGFGNHKHNDQLSFEYHHGGVPLVVDPGSYVYTADPGARNTFRGTASHNTLRVDGVEQNEMKPEWIFRLFESARAEHVLFDDREDAVEYVGRHHGYERLADPVTHERTVRVLKADGALRVIDRLTGRGAHDLRWHLHLAPGVEPSRIDERAVTLAARGNRWVLRHDPTLALSIQPAAYSPSYGVTVPCQSIEFAANVVLEGERTWEFSIQR